MPPQSAEKTIFTIFCGDKPHFCFSGDKCGRKTPYKRKPLLSGFQGHVGGIGGSGVLSENLFSAKVIPTKKVSTFIYDIPNPNLS